MTILEIACIVCELIGVLFYQSTRHGISKSTLTDILLFSFLIIRNVIFLLYFRVWKDI